MKTLEEKLREADLVSRLPYMVQRVDKISTVTPFLAKLHQVYWIVGGLGMLCLVGNFMLGLYGALGLMFLGMFYEVMLAPSDERERMLMYAYGRDFERRNIDVKAIAEYYKRYAAWADQACHDRDARHENRFLLLPTAIQQDVEVYNQLYCQIKKPKEQKKGHLLYHLSRMKAFLEG